MNMRKDVQGLRAFAVLAVIVDHLVGWPGGGFVGVDVFFVISGFLITGLLLREAESRGKISLTGFYRRRVKRIMPAATLVLLVTMVASWVTYATPRARTIADDGVWALLFSANWRFASQSTDYFADGTPPSPLQHYWSLSVEEQFYFVWPWLLVLVFALAGWRGLSHRHPRIVAGAGIALISCASFAWALRESAQAPETAYFSTFSRVWELGVGATLAAALPLLARLPGAVRLVLAWAGLAGMTASLWLVGPGSTFPAPAAALPVLATAMVIVAGTGVTEQRPFLPLTNRVSQYVGDMSYSLYIWHFPVFVLGRYWLGENALALTILAGVTLLVSHYSFHLVEDPVRRSGWLTSGPRHHRPVLGPAYRRRALTFGLVTAVLATSFVLRPERQGHPVDLAVSDARVEAELEELPPKLRKLRAQQLRALDATAWPALDPALDRLADVSQTARAVSRCGWVTLRPVETCTYGDPDARHRAVIIGDSISMTYAGVLRHAFAGDSGWQVTTYGMFGCPFVAEDTLVDKRLRTACPERKAHAVEAINATRPEVVFVAMSAEHHERPDGTPFTHAEWRDSISDYLAGITVPVRTVWLAQPPLQESLQKCYTKVSVPADCHGRISQVWEDEFASVRELGKRLDITVLDSRPWFCAYGWCPAFVGRMPTMKDGVHMTPAYATRLGPVLFEALSEAGVLTSRR